MTTINVCKEIQCPYYKSTDSSGCQCYSLALQCHLLPDPKLQASEYFIYAPQMDTTELKAKNEAYLVQDEKYQRHAWMKENTEMGEVMQFPNRIISEQD